MLKIGDKVKFINQVGGGKIVGFQSKNIVVVENQDGFEIPTMITELIVVDEEESYEKVNRDFRKKTEVKSEPKPELKKEEKNVSIIIKGNDEPKFFMAFVPVNQSNPVGGEIEVYLINDSNFSLLYHYSHYVEDKFTTIDAGELEPNTKELLESISQSDLNNLPRYFFRMIPYMKVANKLVDNIFKSITVNAVKFYKESSFKKNDYFKEKAMIFDLVVDQLQENIANLTEQDFKKVIKEKDAENRPPEQIKAAIKQPEIVEVDLHIEELIDSTNGLSNREILDIQLDKFHREMKTAIENNTKRIVFIHGVGNGVLKQEIAKKLQSTYARFPYQDASFKEYGYGATMVILRRK